MTTTQTRRRLITTLLLGAAGLLRSPQSLAAEAAPETATLRLAQLSPGICIAPQYVADTLLRAEGFADVQYVTSASGAPVAAAVADGKIDFSLNYAGPNIIAIEVGAPIVTPRRRARRLLRIVRARGDPRHCRPQRQKRWRAGNRLEPACVSGNDARLHWARPRQGRCLGHQRVAEPEGAVRGGESRCLPWLCAGPAGFAGTTHRPCRRKQRR